MAEKEYGNIYQVACSLVVANSIAELRCSNWCQKPWTNWWNH